MKRRSSSRVPGRGDVLAALRHRDFARFWASAFVSNTGTWMQFIAVPYLVDHITGSTAWVGISALVTFLPVVLVAPWAGSLADRRSRRTVLLCTCSLMMMSSFGLWALTASGNATRGTVLALVGLTSIGMGLTSSSQEAFVTQLAPPAALVSAIRLNNLQVNAARVVGPALAGVILALGGPETAFLLNAVSFLFVLFALSRIGARPVPATVSTSIRAHFLEGVRYVWHRPQLRWCLLVAGIYMFFGGAMSQIAEPVARHLLGATKGRYGILMAAFGAGALLSGLVTVRFGDAMRRSQALMVALGSVVTAELVVVAAPSFGVGLAGFVLFGAAHVLVLVTIMTVVHGNVEEHFRGRAVATMILGLNGGLPLGALTMGLAAEVIGLRTTILVAASLLVTIVGLVALRTGGLRMLDVRCDPLRASEDTTRRPPIVRPAVVHAVEPAVEA